MPACVSFSSVPCTYSARLSPLSSQRPKSNGTMPILPPLRQQALCGASCAMGCTGELLLAAGFLCIFMCSSELRLRNDAEQRCWKAAAAARYGGAAAAVLVALSCWAPQVAHAGVTLLDLPACQKFTPAGDLQYWCGPAHTFRNMGAERAFTRVSAGSMSACCWM